ncbi:hypothetical protein HPP92_004269 [Vanilla planifolia]|uniref:GTP-eEF1A C-terminal domain-containing protein n=1 Tax=Vanilla planifolia TaxID=51239 RepID=A0A835S941_VANPL|nr:hypothetical protein HPP92_004269 [Vanilla planifolia]
MVHNGSKVIVMPSRALATVRSIERDSSPSNSAKAGDNVAVSLSGIDPIHLMTGCVLCHPDFPVAMATKLELKILVLDISMPIIAGSQIEFYVHHVKEAARVVRIVSFVGPENWEDLQKPPQGSSNPSKVDLDAAVCVEEFARCKALGRVFLRSLGNTVAVGIVTKVLEPKLGPG